MWKNIKKKIIDTLFPQFCLGCGKEGFLICQDCLSTIEILEFRFCPFCEKPNRVFDKLVCLKHQGKNLDGLFCAVQYNNALVKKLIHKFKYEPFLKNLKEPLAFLIISHFLLSENENIFGKPNESFFIPIPLSKRKQKSRGFNQSEEIAKILSDFFKVPLLVGNLKKIKNTSPQIELSKEKRQENVKNVFELKNPEQVRNKTIFLIDDVFTTGATMEECASVLKQAGANQVLGIAVAREVFD